jgi:hypothetical protein
MKSSVPQVRSIEDLKWELAKLLVLAKEATRLSGDVSYLEMAMKPVHELYEMDLKTAANLGKLDRNYVEKFGAAIEKIDNLIARQRAGLSR